MRKIHAGAMRRRWRGCIGRNPSLCWPAMNPPAPAAPVPWRKRLAWRSQALLLGACWRVLGLLPRRAASAAGAAAFALLGPLTARHAFVRRNLAQVLGTGDPARIDPIARGVWGNFGAVLAEYPHLARYVCGAAGADFEIRIDPHAEAIVRGQLPAVYVAAHLANWELATAAIARLGIPFSAVYAPQGNPFLDTRLQARRAALRARFIGKRNALRQLVTELRGGRSVGLLPDQRSDTGEMLPFFGAPAATAISPAWLALQGGVPLVPVHVERLGHARYRTTFHAPLAPPAAGSGRAQVLALSERLNALFESWIRAHPEQWLCLRRRWPRQPAAQHVETPRCG